MTLVLLILTVTSMKESAVLKVRVVLEALILRVDGISVKLVNSSGRTYSQGHSGLFPWFEQVEPELVKGPAAGSDAYSTPFCQ